MTTNKGFTLLELLVVLAVIGILSAIAIPAYDDYAIRAKLAEGMSALSDGRVKMEQFFQDNRTYSGGPAPAATSTFTYAVSGASTTAYTITATGNGKVLGFVMTINEANTKRSTAAPSGWAAATMPTSCWIAKKAGKC
jgi:type IV pilus assembly protein PilE